MLGLRRYPALQFAVALASCTLCVGQSYAQATIDTSTLAGVPLKKTVRSMKDIRYSHIVNQQFDYSCGAAALATLLKYGYGIDIPETELIRRMMVFSTPEVVVKNGFSMLDMKKFVETIGLRGRGFRVNADALQHSIAASCSCQRARRDFPRQHQPGRDQVAPGDGGPRYALRPDRPHEYRRRRAVHLPA